MSKQVIGVYETEAEAMEAVNNLESDGYTPEEISIVVKDKDALRWFQSDLDTTTVSMPLRSDRNKDDDTFWDKVKNLFLGESEDFDRINGFSAHFNQYGLNNVDAEYYGREVELGKIVVLAPDIGTIRAVKDLHEDVERNPERKMKLHEEELDIHKREVSAGEVEIRKEIHEDIKQIDVPVTREEIYVERKPINEVEASDADEKMSEETTRIPLREEKVEVRKRPVVREEVEIGKKKIQETEHVSDQVMREELDVDMENTNDIPSYSRNADAVYLEDKIEDEDERRRRRKKGSKLFDDEDDRL